MTARSTARSNPFRPLAFAIAAAVLAAIATSWIEARGFAALVVFTAFVIAFIRFSRSAPGHFGGYVEGQGAVPAEAPPAPVEVAEAALPHTPPVDDFVPPPAETASEPGQGGAGTPAAKSVTEPAIEAPTLTSKPQLYDAPESERDDLKRIRGVGPKLEATLNRLGVHHFSQIASWSTDEVAWVDAHLEGFKGRVARDGWVEQARALADGQHTDFSQRVDAGEVPTSQG